MIVKSKLRRVGDRVVHYAISGALAFGRDLSKGIWIALISMFAGFGFCVGAVLAYAYIKMIFGA